MNSDTLLIWYVYQMTIVVFVFLVLRSLIRMVRVERANKQYLIGLQELRKLQDYQAELISYQEEYMKHCFDDDNTLYDRTWELVTLQKRIKNLEQSLGITTDC